MALCASRYFFITIIHKHPNRLPEGHPILVFKWCKRTWDLSCIQVSICVMQDGWQELDAESPKAIRFVCYGGILCPLVDCNWLTMMMMMIRFLPYTIKKYCFQRETLILCTIKSRVLFCTIFFKLPPSSWGIKSNINGVYSQLNFIPGDCINMIFLYGTRHGMGGDVFWLQASIAIWMPSIS